MRDAPGGVRGAESSVLKRVGDGRVGRVRSVREGGNAEARPALTWMGDGRALDGGLVRAEGEEAGSSGLLALGGRALGYIAVAGQLGDPY